MEEELRQVFFTFATFGNRVVHNDQVLMDSRSCLKLCRDSGLVGKKLTSTDVDIFFTRVKTKGERKIDFIQFLSLLQLVSNKVNRSHAEVAIQVAGSSPVANCSSLTKPSPVRKPAVVRVDRPDTSSSSRSVSSSSSCALSSATASLSLSAESSSSVAPPPSSESGRAMPRLHPDWYEVLNPKKTCTADTYYYVNRKTQETTWTIPLLVPTSAVTPPPPPPPLGSGGKKPSSKMLLSQQCPSIKIAKNSSPMRQAAVPDGPGATCETEQKSENIFDRLTNPKLYTGAHKHRFDAETGKGKGLGGRDRAAKGIGAMPGAPRSAFKGDTNTGTDETVHSITQFLRS